MPYKLLTWMALLAVAAAKEQSRWSRQISSYTADISDWVPLTGPVESEPALPLKRQAVAEPRILSEPYPELTRTLSGFNGDTFPSRSFYNSQPNRQLYLQSVPSAPQNYLTDQGYDQGLRFGLSPSNFPLTQGFIAPQYHFDSLPQFKPKPQSNTGRVKFDSFSQALPQLPTPVKPFLNQAPKQRPEPPKFVDGYRVENNTDLTLNKRPKPQSLHKIRFDNYDKSKEVINTPRTKVEREEVQLLYVPLESLNKGQFNFRNPITAPQVLNSELFNQVPKQNPLMKNLAAEIQRPSPKPVEAYKPQDFTNRFNSPPREIDTTKYSTLALPFTTTTATTPKPKLKPHQPPLAIFLTQDTKEDSDIKVGDVLSSLKNARTVPVLDSVNPLNAPEVFIGPSSLNPPEGFVKFELPYLSNIENKDKKLKQLPFFVAPLSYNTPQGFAKIPFPSPHVGSVVINSQIQESSSTKSSTVANVFPNSYSDPFTYNSRQPVTQKPKISYYSTAAPKENVIGNNYKQNYYSFEPQTVSTIRPQQESSLSSTKPGTYFINRENQINPSQYVNFPQQQTYQTQEPRKVYNNYVQDTTSTTPSTTVTTRPPITQPTQLLETHNPYSINQGLQFNAPSEYQNFFDEYKESHAVTPGYSQSQTPSPTPSTLLTTAFKYESTQQTNRVTPSYQQNYQQDYFNKNENQNLNVPASNEAKYEQTKYSQSASPSYEQNYQPDIYYNKQNTYESYHQTPAKTVNEYPEKTVPNYNSDKTQPQNSVSVNYNNNYDNVDNKLHYNTNVVNTTQASISESYSGEISKAPETESSEINSSNTGEYNSYNVNYSSEEQQPHTTTTTTTTPSTTTASRRTPPLRTRGRPKYSTKSESNEYSTRAPVTRRPLRERRPSTARSRYEPNKFVTEKTTKQSYESSESTTKSYRQRTRGKIHYKPSEGEETYEKQTKEGNKVADLAYQRDILHQNYPVTLMERASTVDIEAITEPISKSENIQSTNSEDTANAFSNDELAITEHTQPKETVQYFSHEESGSYYANDASLSKNQNYEDNHTKASDVQVKTDDSYTLQTSPQIKNDAQELYERNHSEQTNDSNGNEDRETEPPEIKNVENKRIVNQEEVHQDNVVETTPSYNRVRIRPGVIKQHYQTSTTESSKVKNDRKNSAPITYRPAFDKRRTTMRIEEIEADLKTKQIHVRPEFKDYRQPVYKPDPTTEATSTTTETSTKRGQFRRKRPTYTTTTTEGSINRRPYEAKNRFRGRRPTEKPTEKPDAQLEETTTTSRNIPVNKYRSKFSERFNKKPVPEPEPEENTEDQDPNYSIHRPKYAAPESDHWSPKFSGGSFKPINPNDIDSQNKEVDDSNKDEETDIITVGHDDILISVTPATNNRVIKKIPDIPPTLEALVEQTKVTKNEPSDTMSTFETMLEEVMKSLEEQDEDEYTNKVMKHKGGEIGEIPPERIISSGVNYSVKSTTPTTLEEITTSHPDASSPNEEEQLQNRRRGYWKKVKVRPLSEGIETAESQYYSKTVNRLGQSVPTNSIDKVHDEKPKFKVTTYKPQYSFIKNLFDSEDEELDVIPDLDIPKINATDEVEVEKTIKLTTESFLNKETPTDQVNPGEMDLGTGSPDPTYDDTSYYSEPTEPTSSSTKHDRSDRFSFMDYLFGVTSSDESEESAPNDNRSTEYPKNIEQESQLNKTTTESSYFPEEFTAESQSPEAESSTEATAASSKESVETSSVSSFMDPGQVISTSMSTEISHETEICFRGKCIKTLKHLL